MCNIRLTWNQGLGTHQALGVTTPAHALLGTLMMSWGASMADSPPPFSFSSHAGIPWLFAISMSP